MMFLPCEFVSHVQLNISVSDVQCTINPRRFRGRVLFNKGVSYVCFKTGGMVLSLLNL
jgi:hypothetical protein